MLLVVILRGRPKLKAQVQLQREQVKAIRSSETNSKINDSHEALLHSNGLLIPYILHNSPSRPAPLCLPSQLSASKSHHIRRTANHVLSNTNYSNPITSMVDGRSPSPSPSATLLSKRCETQPTPPAQQSPVSA